MEIYFLRHANAGKPKLNPAKDEQRPLDKLGVEQCHIVGRALAALKIEPDAIIASPLRRAQQTASIVAEEIGHKDKLVTDDALRPEASYDLFQQLLARYKDAGAIIVVGHNPSQTEFLNQLLTGDAAEAVELKKGAVAKLERDGDKAAVLKWIMPPKVVSALQQGSARSSRPKTRSK
ncbi:MAG TPA: phosphohistidine phosphatase SixA [Terriglobales bacterium]|nr:phosphohistidine phosphatase SixA [Terriglobales bacterium]